jgi:hypothetical protein
MWRNYHEASDNIERVRAGVRPHERVVQEFNTTKHTYERDIEIDVPTAIRFLCSVIYNRPTTEAKIEMYGLDMLRGDWHDNFGVEVMFDQSGHLVNGNNRLRAVILSGVPIVVSVKAGLTEVEIRLIDSAVAARTASATSGYTLGWSAPAAIIGGIKALLVSLGVPDARRTEGVDTPVFRCLAHYRRDLERIWGALPSTPNYRRPEIAAVTIAMLVGKGREALDEVLSIFNQDRAARAALPNELKSLAWDFDVYMAGQAIGAQRSGHVDYPERFKAFLSALLTKKWVKNGANGLKDEEFTKVLCDRLARTVHVDVKLIAEDRAPTNWKADPQYIRPKDWRARLLLQKKKAEVAKMEREIRTSLKAAKQTEFEGCHGCVP